MHPEPRPPLSCRPAAAPGPRHGPLARLLWPLLLAACLTLSACRPAPLQEQQAYVFGTRVDLVVAGSEPAEASRAIALVLREFDRLHRAYHAWQPSELSRVNEAIAAGRAQPVSPELAGFIRDAAALAAQGDYLFDPGIGRLIALWGFQADEFAARLPEPAALAAWQARPASIRDLALDGEMVRSRHRQVALDFGGYLKGVALDRASAVLREQGIRNALINIGGNVLALGSKNGRPWRVGLQHPRQNGPLAVLDLHDGEALGTSGDYQRYFELDGRRYPHLLDPRRGEPVAHTQAVSVLIPAGPRAGTLSDALSKPLFVAGPADWPAMARQLGLTQVLRVDASGRVEITAALRPRLEFTSPPADLTVLPAQP